MLVSWSARIVAQTVGTAPEQSIKAAYLYKFAAYVEWPEVVLEDPAAPLTIGVLGADSLADELEVITSDHTVQGRPIEVKRVRTGDFMADSLDGVHILFISGDEREKLGLLAPAARARSILLVTEFGDALERGSVINFRPVDKRIRFEVSLDSADKSQLSISSRLLAVAQRVEPRTQ